MPGQSIPFLGDSRFHPRKPPRFGLIVHDGSQNAGGLRAFGRQEGWLRLLGGVLCARIPLFASGSALASPHALCYHALLPTRRQRLGSANNTWRLRLITESCAARPQA